MDKNIVNKANDDDDLNVTLELLGELYSDFDKILLEGNFENIARSINLIGFVHEQLANYLEELEQRGIRIEGAKKQEDLTPSEEGKLSLNFDCFQEKIFNLFEKMQKAKSTIEKEMVFVAPSRKKKKKKTRRKKNLKK